MTKEQYPESDVEDINKLLLKSLSKHFTFTLYVAGMSRKSSKAIMNIKDFCENHLKDRYELEIIDIYQQTKSSMNDQVIAAPTLIKKLPLPLKKLIGDMSDTNKILMALDVKSRGGKDEEKEKPRREKKQGKRITQKKRTNTGK